MATTCSSVGAGSVGLLTTLAVRSLTEAGQITVVAKHGRQRELARLLGATEVVAPDEVLRGVRRATRAFHVEPEYGSPYLLGGVDVAIDAVGSKQSLDDRAARNEGRRPRRALGHAGSGRPVGCLVPRARGRRCVRIRPTRARCRRQTAFDIATELAGRSEIGALADAVVELSVAPVA